ncbi:S-layer homology domain-containing protein [Paenibacillus xylanivorans]|uniref:SLH domain-containing protein n=1 Tax=Paenibacillus xylanivorans TaxID=1705561 RepID=A0A0M9BKE4_9BACL|nr:S-layer homology domain-containing protein [Paenibacillus xylanivorans]KOY14120.1 hypothetical protein AMS66_23120 [Paenibacillus xylanivorans]
MKKQFTKIAGVALEAALMVGTLGITTPNAQAATTQFSDVKSTHWGSSAITKIVSKGYVDGYTNGKWYTEYVDAASKAGRIKFLSFIRTKVEGRESSNWRIS